MSYRANIEMSIESLAPYCILMHSILSSQYLQTGLLPSVPCRTNANETYFLHFTQRYVRQTLEFSINHYQCACDDTT